jgi:hypothetical protein
MIAQGHNLLISPANLNGIWNDLGHNIFVGKFDNIMILRGVVLVFVLSDYMCYNLIRSFPNLHVHVLDLNPFQVGLSHIGLTGTMVPNWCGPWCYSSSSKHQNMRRAKGERHHTYMHTKYMQASIVSFNWSPWTILSSMYIQAK